MTQSSIDPVEEKGKTPVKVRFGLFCAHTDWFAWQPISVAQGWGGLPQLLAPKFGFAYTF